MEGFVAIHRRLRRHWIFDEPEALKFWISILMDANWSDRHTMFRGQKIMVKRGQLVFGRRSYAAKLGISERKVRRYIDQLELENMASHQKLPHFSIISITNYDSYQKNVPLASHQTSHKRPTNDPTETLAMPGLGQNGVPESNAKTSHKPATLEEKKRILGEKKRRFTPPRLEEVEEFCQERRNGIDAQRFVDFYAAKGWMVGKNKMVCWRSAVRTWEGKNRNTSSLAVKDYIL